MSALQLARAHIPPTLSSLGDLHEEWGALSPGRRDRGGGVGAAWSRHSSPPGFRGTKPALISWVEEEAELWGPDARDPEMGECLTEADTGEVLGAPCHGD